MTDKKPAASPRIAVVGCGYWGRNLVRDFAALGALAAVVDDNTMLRDELANAHSVKGARLEDVLADAAIDGVVIATPAVTHAPLARRALDAGKHVYVEKPLALDIKDGKELVALAESKNRALMIGHLLQYHPGFIALKAFVDSGKLGRMTYVYSNRLSFGILRREEDVLWSFAPHDLSMILSIVGEEPSEVAAFSTATLHPTIGDFCQLQLAFPNGVKGHVFCSWLHPFKEQRLVVCGERGIVVFEDSAKDPRDKLKYYAHRIEWSSGAPRAVKAEGDGEPIAYGAGNPLKDECQHFLQAMQNGSRPRTDGEEGLRVLRVLERATASLAAVSNSLPPAAAPQPKSTPQPGVTIHESAYVDAGAVIAPGSKVWHFSHILGDVTIGENCNIGQNVVIGPRVAIGRNVKIQNNVSVYEGVVLEDGVFCGPSCVFTNVNNPRSEIARKAEYRKTLVRRGASIGANATIVCGHELGEYCFIAAGAVVAGDVPAFALMAGVPAKRIGWMSHAGVKLGADLICPETGRQYRQTAADKLEEIV